MRARKQDTMDCLWALCIYTNHFAHLGISSKMHFDKMDLISPAFGSMGILQQKVIVPIMTD